jgi:hypothetical protein
LSFELTASLVGAALSDGSAEAWVTVDGLRLLKRAAESDETSVEDFEPTDQSKVMEELTIADSSARKLLQDNWHTDGSYNHIY